MSTLTASSSWRSYPVADEVEVLPSALGALSWIAWDTLIHLDHEVEFVWKPCIRRRIVWTDAAYLFVRYVTIFHLAGMTYVISFWPQTRPTDNASFSNDYDCGKLKYWEIWESIYPVLLNFFVELLLITRLRALYHGRKVILVVMYTSFALEQVVVIFGAVFTASIGSGEVTSCSVTSGPGTNIVSYWATPMLFEVFVFALTFKAFRERIRCDTIGRSILDIFVRDGMWAFAMIFGVQMLNVLANAIPGPNDNFPGIIGYCWACSVMSFAISHVVLNLRRFASSDALPVLPTIPSTVRFNQSTNPTP